MDGNDSGRHIALIISEEKIAPSREMKLSALSVASHSYLMKRV
jgi:hypothetical protein